MAGLRRDPTWLWEMDVLVRPAGAPDRRMILSGMTWRSTLPVAAALVLGLGTLFGIWLAARPLEFLVLAIAIAEGLGPPVAWLSRWMKRSIAIMLVYVVLVGVVGGIGWIVVPALFGQGREAVARAPELIGRIGTLVALWDQATGGQIVSLLSTWFRQLASSLVLLPFAVFGTLMNVLLIGFPRWRCSWRVNGCTHVNPTRRSSSRAGASGRSAGSPALDRSGFRSN